MDAKEMAKLRLRIERLRKKLNNCPPEKLLKTSQRTDKLINEYQRLTA